MSEDQRTKGKLIPVDIESDLREHGISLDPLEEKYEYCATTREILYEAYYDKVITTQYAHLNDSWYRVENFEDCAGTYGCTININPDGAIDFDALYYNGSCSWEELVEKKLKEIEEVPKILSGYSRGVRLNKKCDDVYENHD